MITRHMEKRVLVAIDDSVPATAALDHALREFLDAAITVLHVIDADEPNDSLRQRVLSREYDAHRDTAEHAAEIIVENARMYAEEYGREITRTTRYGRPARQIAAYAEENDIDRIVMGTHGRSGLSRLLLGSLSDLVVQRSTVPVTLVCESTATGRIGTPLTQLHEQDPSEAPTPVPGEPPTKWWCPDCTVTLPTRLQFCPGCLGETHPVAGTSD